VRVRVIHFVPDLAEAERFYRTLGLRPELRARTGTWIELTASGGEVDLHDGASAADGDGRDGFSVHLVAEEPLEQVESRLRLSGFAPEGRIVDQEWGRSLFVRSPDGTVVQIDEQDRELYK
jgi:catechol 2,3-dioxygenase-like lactoylglutathione lyase family enzyme